MICLCVCIGNIQEAYTTTLSMTDKASQNLDYYNLVDVSGYFGTQQMNDFHSLNVDLVNKYDSCYYFSYLNKTHYVSSNYTSVEYIVLKDTTVQDIIEDDYVRISHSLDLSLIILPGSGVVYNSSIYSYGNVVNNVSGTDNSYIDSYSDDLVDGYNDDAVGRNAAVYIIKLNLRKDSVAVSWGSIQVSLFMIGLILFW